MSKAADTLLKKAASFEKLAIYSDRKAFLQALSQDVGGNPLPDDAFSDREIEQWNQQSQPQGVPAPSTDAGTPMTPPPAMNTTAPREQQKTVSPLQKLDPNSQKLLSEYVATKGLGMPIDPKEYGHLGPTTRQALDNYKKTLQLKPGQPAKTDAQVFQDLKAAKQLEQDFPQNKTPDINDPEYRERMLNRRT